jgi:hypothetical protein
VPEFATGRLHFREARAGAAFQREPSFKTKFNVSPKPFNAMAIFTLPDLEFGREGAAASRREFRIQRSKNSTLMGDR